jgi:hypothetical protein
MKFKVPFVDFPLNNKAGWGNLTGFFCLVKQVGKRVGIIF